MASFRFRLQVVLDTHRRREQTLEGQLAERRSALARERRALDRLTGRRDAAVRRLAEQLASAVDADAAARGFRYVEAVEAQIRAQWDVVHAAVEQVEEARSALVRCRQDVEMLESLREREHAAFRRAELKRDEDAAGEVATARYVRGMGTAR
jgi:flagellar export protein FliJ